LFDELCICIGAVGIVAKELAVPLFNGEAALQGGATEGMEAGVRVVGRFDFGEPVVVDCSYEGLYRFGVAHTGSMSPVNRWVRLDCTRSERHGQKIMHPRAAPTHDVRANAACGRNPGARPPARSRSKPGGGQCRSVFE